MKELTREKRDERKAAIMREIDLCIDWLRTVEITKKNLGQMASTARLVNDLQKAHYLQ